MWSLGREKGAPHPLSGGGSQRSLHTTKALVSICAQARPAAMGLRSPVSLPRKSLACPHRPPPGGMARHLLSIPLGLDSQILLLV